MPISRPGSTQRRNVQRNRAQMLALIGELRALEARARDKSAQAKPLFDRRGQLLPRERVARLLDIGAPWLELSLDRRLRPRHAGPRRSRCRAAA